MSVFSQKIKELRLDKNLSQNKLAQTLGLSNKTISHYESGYCEPSLDTLINICRHFNISADYLLGLED